MGSAVSLCYKISGLPGVAEKSPWGGERCRRTVTADSKSAERRVRQQWNLLCKKAGRQPGIPGPCSRIL